MRIFDHHTITMQTSKLPGHGSAAGLKRSLLTLALLSTPWAFAQDIAPWYAGASAGPTQATIDNDRIVQNMGLGGFPNSTVSDNNRDTGYKIFGGYQFNRNFALEGSYFDLGTFGFTANAAPSNTLNGKMQLRGLALDAVLMAPIGDKLSVFAKAGAHYSEARDTFRSTGAVIVHDADPSKSELNAKLGIGLQYAFTDALAVRAELERYRVNDAVGSRGDIDHLSVGLMYSWGQGRQPTPVLAPVAMVQEPPAPAPVAELVQTPAPPPPAPEPQPAPVAAVRVPVKVSLAADSLFAFDKSTVSPEGKRELDAFAEKLKTLEYEFVTVTGHTDRFGELTYNMKLSTRRAEAVGNYLVKVSGIPDSKVLARGQSGANPVTKPGDCVGTKPTKALIACLQPDRRVDLEVNGTR
jgi:OOP family OmpA-OmpF porin